MHFSLPSLDHPFSYELTSQTTRFRSFSRHSRDAQNTKRIHYALSLSGHSFLRGIFFFFGTESKREFNRVDEKEKKRTRRNLTMMAAAATTRTVEILRKVRICIAKGLRGFHTDPERGERGWQALESHLPRARWPLTYRKLRTLRSRRGPRNNFGFALGTKLNPFPFLGKFVMFEGDSKRSAWIEFVSSIARNGKAFPLAFNLKYKLVHIIVYKKIIKDCRRHVYNHS